MRKLCIYERDGQYSVVYGGGQSARATTLEKALVKALVSVWDDSDTEEPLAAYLQFSFGAGEILERLLGPQQQGQIHTGIVSQ